METIKLELNEEQKELVELSLMLSVNIKRNFLFTLRDINKHLKYSVNPLIDTVNEDIEKHNVLIRLLQEK